MTRDISGPTSSAPLAFFDPDSSSWRTSQGTFDSDSMLSSRDLPTWGMTRRGALYALPTSAPHIGGSGSSSLLPTPVARDSDNLPGPGYSHSSLPRTVMELLSTPVARDSKGRPIRRGDTTSLPGAVIELLPTPTAADERSSRNITANRTTGNHHSGTTLTDAVALLPELTGDSTAQPSNDGSASWDAPPPTRPSPDPGVV